MRTIRALWRVLRTVVHVLHGLLILWWRFDRLPMAQRLPYIQWWSHKLLRVLGVTVVVDGQPTANAALVVANHVCWLDIASIHACSPRTRFVSKADVKNWPVVGRLTAGVGTLFIERDRKRDAVRVVHQVAEALKAGDLIAVFPEGTTSDGQSVLPFHANLLQAAVVNQVPVQPVALRFSDATHAVSPAAAYVGEASLLESLWLVVHAEQLQVRVQWLPLLPCEGHDRRSVSDAARQSILQALNG